MRVHAYLNREEGAQTNAEYWYRRCGAVPLILTFDEGCVHFWSKDEACYTQGLVLGT
jgi:hypothetical protein